MKTLLKLLSGISLIINIIACQKESVMADMAKINEQPTSGPITPNTTVSTVVGGFETKGKTLLFSGVFTAASHPTSGKAFIYEDTDKSKVLVFENLMSDPGPDLRIYLAADKAASNSIEVFNKVENGSNSYKIPNTADFAKQKTVLIWCKAFSVTFGSAELK